MPFSTRWMAAVFALAVLSLPARAESPTAIAGGPDEEAAAAAAAGQKVRVHGWDPTQKKAVAGKAGKQRVPSVPELAAEKVPGRVKFGDVTLKKGYIAPPAGPWGEQVVPSVPGAAAKKVPGPVKYGDITLKKGYVAPPPAPSTDPDAIQHDQTDLEFLRERARGQEAERNQGHEAVHTIQQERRGKRTD